MKVNEKVLRLITISLWLIACIEFGIAGVIYANLLGSNIPNIIALATTVKPETYTELYFENHLNLPGKIELNRNYPFKFTIHNLENKDVVYVYEVYIVVNGEKRIIDEASVFVKSGDYRTIEEIYVTRRPTARGKIIVNLINKNQQIDFWIEDNL